MFSFKSIYNSKIHIIKITIILFIAHIYKCNFYKNLKCGNQDWVINTFGLICGIIIHNLFWSRLVKNIPIEEKKSYSLCKNMLMYLFSLISQYFTILLFDEKYEIKLNQITLILGILFGINIIGNFIIKDVKSTSHKNLGKERLALNSISNTIFIILVDIIIYDDSKNFLNMGSITSYIFGYVMYMYVKDKLIL